MSRPRFRAVFFDVGGTLVDERDYPRWVEIGRECGLELDEYHLAHAFLEVDREQDTPMPSTPEQFWREVLTRASGAPVDEATTVRFLAHRRARPEAPRLYSDSLRCLVQLQGDGRRLAVISNSTSEEHLRSLLERAGILRFFERLVSSGTEGVAKPDPEIFRRAVARMDLRPSESFYVGNLAYRDAKASALAGLESVWLNREGTGFGEDPPEITSLTELPFYLRSLEGSRDPEARAAQTGPDRRADASDAS